MYPYACGRLRRAFVVIGRPWESQIQVLAKDKTGVRQEAVIVKTATYPNEMCTTTMRTHANEALGQQARTSYQPQEGGRGSHRTTATGDITASDPLGYEPK